MGSSIYDTKRQSPIEGGQAGNLVSKVQPCHLRDMVLPVALPWFLQ